ncbi:beta-galactosidase [Glycomyces sp. L485]|uniref:beta-galactosidase n=1 Tax=Glycomyces sp. L485 TaxID=2909235 RepID=UPI001F4B91DA|nr:beta-galactosidase [Glycomyces sp. L485]MCH7230428.1 beta-galactosidase [Glycomyces sp. L485]
MTPKPVRDIIPGIDGLAFGGDYNPEQWPREVWEEDIALMREAGVNVATVNVFSWASINPGPGKWEFGQLDDIMDLLESGGVKADLATSTASPPPWFSQAHPETLPVAPEGHRLHYGARAEYCPHAPAYQEAVVEMASKLAERYAGHPALAMWHVGNEYYRTCFCDLAAAEFQAWLRDRYGDLDGLNDAWGTTFWSQTYTDWEQVLPPRACAETPNPSFVLDYRRFGSDARLKLFNSEAAAIAEHSPDKPITTNLMVTGNFAGNDYFRWGKDLNGENRLISVDHYLVPNDTITYEPQVAYAAALSRGLAHGHPWLLMEQSANASAWRGGGFAKRTGEQLRHSLGYVAHGSEGAMYFQWRASRYGTERWHAAMVPHGGRETKTFQEVVQLGQWMKNLAEIKGSTVQSQAAILLDFESVWAHDTPGQLSSFMTPFPELRRWHAALWKRGITCDIAHPAEDLSRYPVVFAPSLQMLDDDANLRRYVEGGGTLVVGPFSGVTDRNEHVHPGMPGALRDLLGVRVVEHVPLREDEMVALDDGTSGAFWAETAASEGAEVIVSYVDYPGTAAIFHRAVGSGQVWYLTTRPTDLNSFLDRLDLQPEFPGLPEGVETVRRTHEDGRSYLFALNHTDKEATIPASGHDLLANTAWTPTTTLPANTCAVIREVR